SPGRARPRSRRSGERAPARLKTCRRPEGRPGKGALPARVDRPKTATVALDGGAEVLDVVVAELLAQGIREHERQHRLGDHARSGYDAHIAPLHVRGGRLAAAQVG